MTSRKNLLQRMETMVPSTAATAAKSPPAEEEQGPDAAKAPSSNVATVDDSAEAAKSDTEMPPCTPRKKMPTSASSRKNSGTPSTKATSSPPDSLLLMRLPLQHVRSTSKKSRGRQSRKKSDSPPPAEKEEEQGPLSPPQVEKRHLKVSSQVRRRQLKSLHYRLVPILRLRNQAVVKTESSLIQILPTRRTRRKRSQFRHIVREGLLEVLDRLDSHQSLK